MQHETIELILLEEQVETLHVFLGAERERGERLRLASREERRAVNAGEQAHLAGTFANLVESAAIGTSAGIQDIVAENIFAKTFKSALGEGALLVHFLLGLFGNGGEDFFLERIHQVVAFFLWMLFGVQRIVEPVAVFLFQILVDAFIEGQGLDHDFFRLELAVKLLNGRDNLLNLRVAKFESVNNGFFGNFQRAGFDHDDGFFRAGNDDIQQALLLLSNGRVGDELAIEQTNANAGDGLLKRQIRGIASRRCAGNRDDIGIIVAIGGKHHADNLGFIAPSFGEQRAERAVNQPGSENLFFGRASFALEEAAGNLSCRVGIFAVVHGERKKISIVGYRRHTCRGEHDRIAVARHNGAVGLFGNFSSFENQRPSADFDGDLMRCV